MDIFRRSTGLACMTTWVLAGLPCTASAAEAAVAAAVELTAAAATPAAPERTPAPAALRGSRVLSAAALAGKRGGTAVASEMQLSGVVTNNRVSDASTGSNLITQGAFAGAAGLPMVIQNSGNNVLIQNATIVNLQLQ